MTNSSSFDVTKEGLPEGRTLIEASAGTGKTWTLTALFVRTLLEREDLEADRILLVTFTKAATAELRERLRQRLNQAIAQWGDEEAEPWLREFSQRDGAKGLARLQRARRRFDRIRIGTLHATCRRWIEDHGRLMNAPATPTIAAEDPALDLEVAAAWWREQVFPRGPLVQAVAARAKLTPESLVALQKKVRSNTPFAFVPPPGDLDQLLADLDDKVEALPKTPGVAAWAAAFKAFKWTGKGPPSEYAGWLPADWLAFGDPTSAEPWARFLAWSSLGKESSISGMSAPVRRTFMAGPVYPHCEDLAGLGDRIADALREAFLREFPRRAFEARVEAGRLTFDDLVQLVATGLRDSNEGNNLAAVLREEIDLAFIDEFQDTDSTLYEIFDALFPQGPLCFVGDPKQLLYEWRGADLRTYITARDQADSTRTLGCNYRSRPPLVEATNALYVRAHDPFFAPGLLFDPVEAGAPASKQEPRGELFGSAPVSICWWTPEPDVKLPLNKNQVDRPLAEAMAKRCARWLDGSHWIEDEVVRPKDLAVLVRTNQQALDIARELERMGLPFEHSSREDAWGSLMAEELDLLLGALVHPRDRSRRRAALATRVFGLRSDQLVALEADPLAAIALEQDFEMARRHLQRDGVLAMVRGLLHARQTDAALAGEAMGERDLLDLLHLAELCDEARADLAPGLDALCAWVAVQRDLEHPGRREQNRRSMGLEDAITIATVHKSKGLEFPIVICPYLWNRSDPQGPPFTWTDDQGTQQICTASRLTDDAKALAEIQDLRSAARVLYVALTRAAQQLEIVFGPMKGAALSALGWLLLSEKVDETDHLALRNDYIARWKGKEEDCRAVIEAGLAGMDGAVQLVEIGERDEAPPRPQIEDATLITGPLAEAESVQGGFAATSTMSFSRLAHSDSAPHAGDRPPSESAPADEWTSVDPGAAEAAPDAGAASDASSERLVQLDGFARGAHAGTALHATLEQLLPRPDELVDADLSALRITRILQRAGLESASAHPACTEPVATVQTWAQAFAQVPWLEGRRPIAAEPIERQHHEWAFHLGRAKLIPSRLATAFARSKHAPLVAYAEHLRTLSDRPLQGYLKGFIDLLLIPQSGPLEIVDWKSHGLGDADEDYAPAALEAVMAQSHYHLQAHLYSVAVRRFASTRQSEPEPMVTKWIFLRGVDAAGSRGIYRHEPEAKVLDALDEILALEAEA